MENHDTQNDELTRALADLQRLLYAPGGQVPVGELTRLVEIYPEVAAAFAKEVVDGSSPAEHGQFQRAWALGAIFNSAFSDDSLLEYVRLTIEERGIEFRGFRFLGEENEPRSADETADQPTSALISLQVTPDLLRNGDISRLKSLFANPLELRKYRGRCLLTFDVDDPREVWEIPRCREYLAKLSAEIPAFPYVIDGDVQFRYLTAYFACLSPADAIGPGGSIILTHPNVVEVLATAAWAVWLRCLELGDDPDTTCRDLFRAIPDEFVDVILMAVEKRFT